MNTFKIHCKYTFAIHWLGNIGLYEINKFDRLKNFLHFVMLLIIIISYTMINSFSFEIEKKYLIMNIRSFKDFLKCLKLFDLC